MVISVASTPAGGSALTLALTDELLSHLMVRLVGGGIAVPHISTEADVPLLGPSNVDIDLTITGGRARVDEGDMGRIRVEVDAAAILALESTKGMTLPPQDLGLLVTVLVAPTFERVGDGLRLGLDIPGSELVGVDLRGADGQGLGGEQMGQMIGAQMGDGMFDAVRSSMFDAEREILGLGTLLDGLGVAEGPPVITAGDGHLIVALPAIDKGRPGAPVPQPRGTTVGIGATSAGLAGIVTQAVAGRLGALPVPFELDMQSRDGQLVSRVRNAPLLPEFFPGVIPDVRAAARLAVEPRLGDGRLRLAVSGAWMESPLVPRPLNRLSRALGGAAGLLPLGVSVPSRGSVDLPIGDASVDVSAEHLHVVPGGVAVGIVVD